MKPNIAQKVVPRKSRESGFSSKTYISGKRAARWSTGRVSRRQTPSWKAVSNTLFQRGSTTHSTLTLVFGVSALVIVGMLGFFYLQQVLTTASQGTNIQQLESQVVELRQQQKELELEGAELRSLQAVEDRVNKLNLVTADKVTYLNDPTGKVATLAE